jgi:hypothetical protein
VIRLAKVLPKESLNELLLSVDRELIESHFVCLGGIGVVGLDEMKVLIEDDFPVDFL